MDGDYTQASLSFKFKKVFRYIRLYGLSKTWVKVRGQYHMKAAEEFEGPRWENPGCSDPASPRRRAAFIGCGNYAFSHLGFYLGQHDSKFLRATYDVRKNRSRSLCKSFGGAYAASDWREILADPQVEIVYIASNHASHAEYAIACLEAGKHVHIEKPHVVTKEQLERLADAMQRHPGGRVFLGFNRPRSPLFRQLRAALDRESGPSMVNWFIAGHEIGEDHWYYDAKEGGRVLGNLCHWTDLTLHLVRREEAFPCKIIPATIPGAKSDFAVSVLFANGSTASITFSAKGHTFEGVREVLNLHRGNLLANLSDFQSLTLDIVERRVRRRLRHRDHAHGVNIVRSFEESKPGGAGEDPAYIVDTARFFLAIRDAIESGESVTV